MMPIFLIGDPTMFWRCMAECSRRAAPIPNICHHKEELLYETGIHRYGQHGLCHSQGRL